MAARLISQEVAGSAENPLIIWNRTTSKCTALKEQFPDKSIIIKETAKEVVEACKITYSMLSTPEVSKIVFEADNGVLAGVSEGKSIVDCATLAEEDMKRMNTAVTGKGGYVIAKFVRPQRRKSLLRGHAKFVLHTIIKAAF